jgi:hypothetical protein
MSLRFTVEASSLGHEFLPLGFTQSSFPKFSKIDIHWDDVIASRPVSSPCDSLSPSWVMKAVISSAILHSHHCPTFDPVCMLCPRRVGPVIKRLWPQNRSVDHSLG